VGGLAAADYSPGVVLLDAVRDRLRQLAPDAVPREQVGARPGAVAGAGGVPRAIIAARA
jgi:hypothetical protein